MGKSMRIALWVTLAGFLGALLFYGYLYITAIFDLGPDRSIDDDWQWYVIATLVAIGATGLAAAIGLRLLEQTRADRPD